MANSPNLGLPYISDSQAQKHYTANEAFRILDAMVQLSVKGRTLVNPPGSPAEADRWIIPAGATGVWAGKTNQIAVYQDGAWAYFVPDEGWIAFCEDEGSVVFVAGAWTSYMVVTSNGAAMGMDIAEEEVIVSGATTDTSIVIPARSIVLAVSVRTNLAITGATSYNCGVVGNTSQFGGSLGIALGSSNIGVIGPTAFYSDTPVRLTANGSNFTAGRVRVAIQYLKFNAPTS